MKFSHLIVIGMLVAGLGSAALAAGDQDLWHDGTDAGYDKAIERLEGNGYVQLPRYAVTITASINGQEVSRSAVWQTLIRTWKTGFPPPRYPQYPLERRSRFPPDQEKRCSSCEGLRHQASPQIST